ncbi:MAG: NAD(P)/FAD-dependent oxidoreductase [Legionellaceae bacterium]|nr:NAD(P)/FAD-dependent oxidoreductase [Legionellaceae bacterium]
MHVMIIGAGPTGLMAGIELARQGVKVDIIDKKKQGSTLSRAVGINPHSLKILEASGVTEQLLAAGIQYQTADFYRGTKPWATAHLTAAFPVQYGYNFMLGLPQDETETILRERFVQLGGHIQYDTEMKDIVAETDGVTVITTSDKTFRSDYLIGADGAHGLTRYLMGIESIGFHLKMPWSIADVDVKNWPYATDGVSLFLLEAGKIVFVAPIGVHRFRLVSNTERVLNDVPFRLDITNIRREGDFKIRIAQVKEYSKGRVFLAGDAAHSHSPAGGRGMNLGIADAADLADKLVKGDTSNYTKSRYKEGKQIIGGSERFRKALTAKNPIKRCAILGMLKLVTSVPLLQKKIAAKFLYG